MDPRAELQAATERNAREAREEREAEELRAAAAKAAQEEEESAKAHADAAAKAQAEAAAAVIAEGALLEPLCVSWRPRSQSPRQRKPAATCRGWRGRTTSSSRRGRRHRPRRLGWPKVAA